MAERGNQGSWLKGKSEQDGFEEPVGFLERYGEMVVKLSFLDWFLD